MRLSEHEKFARTEANSRQQSEIHGVQGLLRTLLGGPPNPTQLRFILSNDPRRAYMGFAGAAKTSTLAAAALIRCLLIPGYKFCMSRFDYNDLMGTTLPRLEEMMHRLPTDTWVDRNKDSPETWWIRPIVGDTTKLSTVQFHSLKEYLGSYEFHGAAIDEADEVEGPVANGLRTRLRAPGHDVYELMMAFNPPDKTHWLYSACTGLDHREKPNGKKWLSLYTPMPKENNHNLPVNYYEDMSVGMPPDMVDRLVRGQWGMVFTGEAVYREFGQLHIGSVPWVAGRDLLRFWDFGFRRPAVIWASFDDDGQLQVHRAFLGEHEEVGPLALRVKTITAQHFAGYEEVHDFGDPAVRQHKDTGSALNILADHKIIMMHRKSDIMDGVRTGRMLLSTLNMGRPAVMFDRDEANLLIRSLAGGYHLDRSGSKPIKDGYYDHLADAWRYGIINLYHADGTPMPSSVETRSRRSSMYSDGPTNIEYDPRYDKPEFEDRGYTDSLTMDGD